MQHTVLITGATGGIGEALVRAFHARGCSVVAAYHRNEEKAAALVAELGEDRMLPVQCDVGDSGSVNRLFEAARRQFGEVGVLINNAGNAQFGLLTDLSDDDWHRILRVHLDGCFYCCRAALPAMVHQKSGVIINISSIWGITGGSCETAYSAAKAGVIGLTKALAKEVGPSGITVNCIAPGVIDTPMNARLSPEDTEALIAETPLMKLGTGADVAELAVFLAEKGGFITGQVLSPNGGICI